MKHFLLAMLLLAALPAFTQIAVTELTYPDGLKEEHISSIVQDKRGCIWMGTFGGLCSYDGYRRVCYKASAGDQSPLASNRIQFIACNADNNIWCISNDQVSLFDTHTRRFVCPSLKAEGHSAKTVETVTLFPLEKSVTWTVDKEGNGYRLDDRHPEQTVRAALIATTHGAVQKVFQDAEGNEWVLTTKRVWVYGKEGLNLPIAFDHYTMVPEGVGLASRSGNIYFYAYSSGKFRKIVLPPGTGDICQLLAASDGSLYIAARKGIWHCPVQSNHPRCVIDLSGYSSCLQNISKDKEKYLWGILADGTVIRCHPAGGQVWKMSLKEATGGEVTDFSHVLLLENSYGEIWFSLRQRGDVLYWDRSAHTIRQPETPYRTADIRGRFIDNQSNVWIRKSRGIDKISFHGIQHHWDVQTGGHEIRCMMKDSEGSIWLADKGGYLRKFDKNRQLVGYLNASGRLVRQQEAFGAMIYAMLQDRDGTYWLGSRDKGLFHWNATNGTLQHYRNLPPETVKRQSETPQNPSGLFSLSDDAVFSLTQDKQGRIWVGTLRGGLNLIDTSSGKLRFLHAGNGLFAKEAHAPRCVRSLLEISEQHVLLMATMDGVYVLSTRFTSPRSLPLYRNARRPADPESISNNEVLYLMRKRNQEVYATTNSGGINRFISPNLLSDTIRFQSYTEKDGAYSDLVLSMIEDQKGRLWTISERILSCFDPQRGTFLNYGSQYLRPNLIFSEAAPLLDGDMLMFGTTDGLFTFHPDDVRCTSFVPPIVFTRLMIQGKESERSADTATELMLHPKERTLTIGFAALDYNQSQPIRYRYRMIGLNEQWWEVDESRSASYVNLPPDNYRFEVESTNSDGTWVGNRRSLPIHVIPTFWETGWAKLMYILLASIALFVAFHLYRRFYSLQLRIRAEQEITDAKLRFFTDISHELRTPLTLIDAPVNLVLEQDKTLSAETRTHLELVRRNTNRMLQLVNQILDFRKMQNQKMKLLLQETDVRSQLNDLLECFASTAEQHRIELSMECPDDLPTVWIDRDKFEKIFFNLLSNALKYTPDGKRITVRLLIQAPWLTISVCDEGIGISEEQFEVLFKRFETILQSNLFKASSGIGLALVKQFTDLHLAQLKVESKPSEGSTFSISFPLNKETYTACSHAEFITPTHPCASVDSLPSGIATKETFKILIVEDNPELRLFLRNILQNHYQVFEADNGEQGLNAVRQCWPDLILSDVMMPRMDGFEMVRLLKHDDEVCHIPIVLLTAKTLMTDQLEGIRLGVDDYLLKPFNASYLLARISALIEGRKQLQQHYLNRIGEPSLPAYSEANDAIQTLSGLNATDERFASLVVHVLEQQLDNAALSVEQLAAEMNMGRTVFFNKIKAIMGCSPVELIQSVRIRNAIRLFDEGENVISDVAYRTGFSDPKYFSRCFKKQTGQTPSEYIKRRK